MIIYTDLQENSIIFKRLKVCAAMYNIDLKSGVKSLDGVEQNKSFEKKKVLFWFARSNEKKLVYYRVCDALENIWKGLVILENHRELIK